MSGNEDDVFDDGSEGAPVSPEPQHVDKNTAPVKPDEADLPIIEGIEDKLAEQRRLNTVMLLSDMQELGEDIEKASNNLSTIWTGKQRDELETLIRTRAHKAAFDECYEYLMNAGRESRNTQTVLFSLKTTLNRLSEKIKIMDNI